MIRVGTKIFGHTAFGEQECEGTITSIASMEPEVSYNAVVGVMEEGELDIVVKEIPNGVWIVSEEGQNPSILHRWMFFKEDDAYESAIETNKRKMAMARRSIRYLKETQSKSNFKGFDLIVEIHSGDSIEYIVTKGGKSGIMNDMGEILVPVEMDEIQGHTDCDGAYLLRKS